jgi:hypothetical protein
MKDNDIILFFAKFESVLGTKINMKRIQPKGSFNITIIREEDITLIIVYLFSVKKFIIIIGIVEKKLKTIPNKGINICELNKITVNTVKKAVIEIFFVI